MKKILLAILAIFVVIQFFQIDKTNPATNKTADFLIIKNTSPEIAQQIRNTCYDCHSNEAVYPWYANVQPIGWFLKHHIDEGRRELNFSEFSTYEPKKQAHKLDEASEQIEKGEMPLESYTLIHKNAVLTDVQKKELADYFKKISADIKTFNSISAEAKNEQPRSE